MCSPVVRAYFAVNGMKVWDANEFFDRLLTITGKPKNSDLDLHTFVAGCMRLQSPGMDLGMYTAFNELRKSQKILTEQVKELRLIILREFNIEEENEQFGR